MMLHTQMEPPPLPPADTKAKEAEIESGTVISWDMQSGTGRILSDKDDQALFVHQCDLTFVGEGKRRLPLWHQCEFQRSMVNGSHVASRVSRTHGRPFLFNEPPPEKPKSPPLPAPTDEKGKARNILIEKLLQYQCRLTTNASIQSGKIYYFHGEFRYGVIIPDHDTDKRVYADAASFEVIGSFLNVRKGLCVEYQTGKNSEGKEVATNVTGPGRKPIDHETRVDLIVPQKLGKRKASGKLRAGKRLKQTPAKETKPIIPEGKNPISIFYEFANCCNPKRIPSVKLVSQNTRPSGMVSDFTFEARLDDKPIAQGRAKTKKDAKTYAAHYALEVLEKESAVYRQELTRIKKGVPSVKKQMRNFTKRRWRPRFTGPASASSKFSSGTSSNILSRSLLKQPKFDVLSTPGTTLGTSYLYQPTLVVANQLPAVSLTTYNPVNNTTSTSYMNQATAQKFVPATAKPKEAQTYQPQAGYYANQYADASRYAAFGNAQAQYAAISTNAATQNAQAQYAARTAATTAATSNPWQSQMQNQMTYAAAQGGQYQQKPATYPATTATTATTYQPRPT